MNKYFGEWYFEDIIAHIDKFELGTKIKSERGDIYNLSQAEGEGSQRKFSRWNGTKLRFMTYDNIGKKFEILEDNTEEQEKLGESWKEVGKRVGEWAKEFEQGFKESFTEIINYPFKSLEDNTEEIEELDNWFVDERKECREFDIQAINLCFCKHRDKINELVKAVNEIRKDLNK